MDLSVVIVSYNVKCFLEHCLLSVQKASAGLEVEVWVVDNHSEDGSVEFLKPRFPGVRFVENQTNEGFARANNRIMKDIRGTYVLFLNPDTLVGEDCFRLCIDCLKQDAAAGGLGVRMIDGSGRFLPESKRSFPSPQSAFCKVTGLHHLFPSSDFFSSYYAVNVNEKAHGEVDVLSGAFFMIRRDVLLEVGGFDTDYFMYGDDIDLSYRLQKAGFRNHYLGSVTIIHFKGESTNKKTRTHIQHFYGAMSLFVRKHYRGMMSLLMKAGIVFSKTLAYLSLYVFPPRANKAVNTARNIFFLGDSGRVADVIRVLEKAGIAYKFSGQASELPSSGLPADVNAVVLQQGSAGFSKTIKWISELPPGIERLFSSEGSSSLVGSGNKNERGIMIGP